MKEQCPGGLKKPINTLSPNSGQHQFSPNEIHTLSRHKVMSINKN